jgi:hypothetical protein
MGQRQRLLVINDQDDAMLRPNPQKARGSSANRRASREAFRRILDREGGEPPHPEGRID